MEKDKAGENVACFDCCFHPDAITLGNTSKEFRDLMVKIALEGIEESYKLQHQTVSLLFIIVALYLYVILLFKLLFILIWKY
jgi:hypothetical protein